MEGVMKKKLLLVGVAALTLACASVQAGYLRIDNDDDIERVSNNISHFWSQHQSELDVFLNKKKDKFSESLESINNSDSDLIVDIKRSPKIALEEMDFAISYLKQDRDFGKKYAPELIESTRKGIVLLRNLLKAMI